MPEAQRARRKSFAQVDAKRRGSEYEEIAPHSPCMKERVLKQQGPEEKTSRDLLVR